MSNDQSLNEPLTGAEIKTIIIDRVMLALSKDSTLDDDLSYPGFDLSFTLDLKYLRSDPPSTMAWGVYKQGEKIEEKDSTAQADKVTGHYETDSPNLAREEHDLDQPVLIQTPSGPERKMIKRGRPAKVRDEAGQ